MKHYHSFAPFVLCLFLAMVTFVSPVSAADETYDLWDGTTSAVTAVGTTYTIHSAKELAWIAEQNDAEGGFAGKTIVLDANIDLNGSNRMRVWMPIGSEAHPFAGVFNGQHHLLRGLGSINAEDGVGLFGHVAAAGVIKDLGISGGRIVAVGQRRVGALAGVCAGQISGCWSMAEIAMSGNVTGGLIGEMKASGSLSDSYCSCLIRNAGDTVGVLIGMNAGSLTRAYTTGYAKNGCAFVGASASGASYTRCYYDRKLYFQEPGALSSGLIAINDTYEMFNCLLGDSHWKTNNMRYPELTGFVGKDASSLSVAAVYVDTICKKPVNHANDLTVDLLVDTVGGIEWSTQEIQGSEWINFNENHVTVVRPCAETDVLTTAQLRDEKKTVYFRPRRVEELKVGIFAGKQLKATVCWGGDKQISKAVSVKLAEDGWGEHHYMVVRFGYDGSGNMYPIDTICTDATENNFLSWYNGEAILGDSVGDFVLRAYVHDERCVPDWMLCDGRVNYTVLPEFHAGKIPTQWDTLYMSNGKARVTITEIEPASGGDGKYSYAWRLSANAASFIAKTGADGNLSYDMTAPATKKTFYRYANDSTGCGGMNSEGVYTVTIFEEFIAGAVSALSKRFYCSVEEAQTKSISATPATGGSGTYMYQWYIESGSTLTPIPGATDCNLPLNKVSLVAGGDYVFVRFAKDDTRFTEWTRCDKQQVVHVMQDLAPGAIETGDRGHRCVDPDATTITITVNETTAATGESSMMQYRWIRINGEEEVTVGNTASLSYNWKIDDSNSFIQYTYVREVKHGDCEWKRSAGALTEEYGIRDKGEIRKTVCNSQMPFTMHWKDSKGNDKSHTFAADGETWKVTDDYNAKGCPADTTITISVAERPLISTETEANFCQKENKIYIYFDQTAGDADMFNILYSDDFAKCMGREDTMGYVSAPGTIIIRNVPPIPEGNHYLDVQVGISGGAYTLLDVECYSPVTRVNIVASLGGYMHSKFSRVLYVDNNPNNGEVPAPKLHFTAYQWYKNGVAVEGATDQYYQENGNELKGVYYVRLTDDSGKTYRSCDKEMPDETAVTSTSLSPTIYPVPALAGEPVTLTCYRGEVEIYTCTGDVVQRAQCTENAITLAAPNTTGIYYVRIIHEDGSMQTEKLIVK